MITVIVKFTSVKVAVMIMDGAGGLDLRLLEGVGCHCVQQIQFI